MLFERRLKWVAVVCFLFFALLGVRLFTLQVVEGEDWREEAAKLSRRHLVLSSRRGSLFDRHGEPLAEDRLEYDIVIRLDRYDEHPWECADCGRPAHTGGEAPPRRCPGCGATDFEAGEPIDWSGLPSFLGLSSKELHDLLGRAWREYEGRVEREVSRRKRSYDRVRRSDVEKVLLRREWTLVRGVGPEAVREVALHPARYHGLDVRPAFRRARVREEALRSLVGTVGLVGENETGRYRDEGCTWTQIWRMRVGRSGVEKGLESVLGSRDGWREVDRDRRGRVREILDEEPPRDGRDIRLSIDAKLQVLMTEALARASREHKAKGGGGFVAVDPRTGEVLVLASHAGENSGGLHLGAASATPGSVFKIVTALAGLESGTLSPSERFECAGSWHGIGCSHDHGTVDLLGAISKSCNKYFARVADRLDVPGRREIEVLAEWARAVGFGRRTGIPFPLESAGLVPTPEWRAAQYEKDPERWRHPAFQRGELWRVGFGQGPVLATPLQIARLMAIVANGGRRVDLTLLYVEPGREVTGDRILRERTVRLLREGMRRVVVEGTASRLGLDRFRASGKTGTADLTKNGSRHMAWFAGYAPAEAPRVAFACYLRDTPSYGAEAAAPVVLEFLEEVLRR